MGRVTKALKALCETLGVPATGDGKAELIQNIADNYTGGGGGGYTDVYADYDSERGDATLKYNDNRGASITYEYFKTLGDSVRIHINVGNTPMICYPIQKVDQWDDYHVAGYSIILAVEGDVIPVIAMVKSVPS